MATWGQRAVAYLINVGFIIAAFMLAAVLLAIPIRGAGVLRAPIGIAAFVYPWYVSWQDGSSGQSPGKALMGLRVVSATTGAPVGGALGLVRAVVQVALGFVCGIGPLLDYTWPLHDDKRQTIHDKTAGAVVLAHQPRRPLSQLFRP